MDNLTHTLFATTLARTPLGRAGPGTTAALVIASNIPDIDIIATAGGEASYLQWHRGPTHGPLGIVGLGLVSAAIVWIASRWSPLAHGPDGFSRAPDRARGRRGRPWSAPAGAEQAPPLRRAAAFGELAIVSTIGVMMHVLMDLPTVYGTRILSPFDWHWFAVDWMPIVDIWLIAVLVAGLLLGRGSMVATQRSAMIVLALMAANYGVRAAAHDRALGLAPQLIGAALPERCDSAPSPPAVIDSWPRKTSTTPAGERPCLIEMAAMPTFVSPFTWRIITQLSNAYEIREIDLLDARASAGGREMSPHDVRRYPNVWTPAVEKAASTHLGRVFLGFSRFPAARSAVDDRGVATVRWDDMRFVDRPPPVDQPVQRSSLFTAIVRIGPDGQILEERLR